MSIKLMNLAWQCGATSTQKLVLIALADWCNDDGVCWPSLAKLADKTSLTERGLRKIIRNLEEAGLLLTEEKPGKGNLYHVTLDPGTTFPSPRNEVPPTPEPRSSNTFIDTSKTLLPIERSSRKKMLPPEWKPEQVDIDWSLKAFPSLTRSAIDNETDRFRDYWIAEGRTKADWRATWRNWIRRSIEYAAARKGQKADRTSDNYRRLSKALDELGLQQGDRRSDGGQQYLIGPD